MLTALCFATSGCKSKNHAVWSNCRSFWIKLWLAHTVDVLATESCTNLFCPTACPPRVHDDVMSSWCPLKICTCTSCSCELSAGSTLILYIANSAGDSQATTCMWFYQKDHNNEEETLYCVGDSQATTCMWFYQKDHNNEEETLYCHGSSYVGSMHSSYV